MQPPLLQRSPLGSGLSQFQYDPCTFLLRFPNEFLPPIGGDPDFVQKSTAIHGTLVHERFHWTQCQGTSIGALLSLLKYSQERTTWQLIGTLPKSVRKKLFNEWQSGTQSIVSVNSVTGGLEWPHVTDHSDLNVFRQIWHDHLVVSRIFDCSDKQDQAPCDRSTAIAEVMADGLLYLSDVSDSVSYPGNDIARDFYRFPEDSITFIRVDEERITTRNIMECAATIQAFHAIQYSSFQLFKSTRPQSTEVIAQLLTSSYGTPLRAFLNLAQLPLEDWQVILPTVSVICDWALNPPVPPIYITFAKKLSWREIYPPFRFALAAKLIPRIGLLPYQADNGTIKSYIDDLSEELGFVSPSLFQPTFNIAYDFQAYIDDHTKVITKDATDYYNFILWTQELMWKERRSSLPVFANFGECTAGALSMQYAEKILRLGEHNLFQEPLVWTATGNLGHSLGIKLGSWFAVSSAVGYLTYDIVVGKPPIQFTAYPPALHKEPGFAEKIQTTLYNIFSLA